jgi:hypothetical protein
MDKQELLDGIKAGREQLESLWAGLDDAEMTRRPGPQADWSVKDLIAHLTFWEQTAVDDIRTDLNGGPHVIFGAVDEVNAQVFAKNCDRALADIQADFARSRQAFEALVAELPDDVLNDRERFTWLEGESAAQLLADESYGHYADHMADLRAYVNSVQSTEYKVKVRGSSKK